MFRLLKGLPEVLNFLGELSLVEFGPKVNLVLLLGDGLDLSFQFAPSAIELLLQLGDLSKVGLLHLLDLLLSFLLARILLRCSRFVGLHDVFLSLLSLFNLLLKLRHLY